MDSITKQGIDWCFPDEMISSIASIIISKNDKTSLQYQSIKAIMKSEMVHDYKGNLIFSLIFKEPIYLWDFMEKDYVKNLFNRGPKMPYTFSWNTVRRIRYAIQRPICRVKRNLVSKMEKLFKSEEPPKLGFVSLKKFKGMTGDFDTTFQTLRTDPEIILSAFDQNLAANCDYIRIIIDKTDLTIEFDMLHVPIAQIAHRENMEYDLFWAGKFATLAFSKKISWVSLIRTGELHQWNEMQDHLNSFINTFPKVEPLEGWEEAFKKKNHTIYTRSSGCFVNSTQFVVQFETVKFYEEMLAKHYRIWNY